MGTKFITISRTRLEQNRKRGADDPVIRVEDGNATTLGGDLLIDGASRVVYRPGDDHHNGAEVWVETDAEVRRIASEPARLTQLPPRPQSAVSRAHDVNFFAPAMAHARRRLESAAGADREAPLRRLAELCRQAGALADAAACYRQILELVPHDRAVQRLLALLDGRPPEVRTPGTWPARFARIDGFLAGDRLTEILRHIEARKDAFAQTPVDDQATTANAVSAAARWCATIRDIDAIAEWFVPLLESRLPALTHRLGLAPFAAEIRDCKLTRYGNGSFFGPHVDRGPGVESRVLGFVYDCHVPPKRYSGGGLAIYDRDLETGGPSDFCTTLIPDQNQLIVLDSDCWHEVLPVRCVEDDWTAARFTVNGWINRRH